MTTSKTRSRWSRWNRSGSRERATLSLFIGCSVDRPPALGLRPPPRRAAARGQGRRQGLLQGPPELQRADQSGPERDRGTRIESDRCAGERAIRSIRQAALRPSTWRVYLIATALTCLKVVWPRRTFWIPSCTRVAIPSWRPKLSRSSVLALDWMSRFIRSVPSSSSWRATRPLNPVLAQGSHPFPRTSLKLLAYLTPSFSQ